MISEDDGKRGSKDSGSNANENNNDSIEKPQPEIFPRGMLFKRPTFNSKSMAYDIFNDAAMENAYYVCHNVQDVLKSRGFAWPDGQKKKKKGKR